VFLSFKGLPASGNKGTSADAGLSMSMYEQNSFVHSTFVAVATQQFGNVIFRGDPHFGQALMCLENKLVNPLTSTITLVGGGLNARLGVDISADCDIVETVDIVLAVVIVIGVGSSLGLWSSWISGGARFRLPFPLLIRRPSGLVVPEKDHPEDESSRLASRQVFGFHLRLVVDMISSFYVALILL